MWKKCLQDLVAETQMEIHVSHFPVGTSKWNKIEHCLFCFISKNWRGRSLEDLVTIVSLIVATKTKGGLEVSCTMDLNTYERGKNVEDKQLKIIMTKGWYGELNYVIYPEPAVQISMK